MLRVFFAENDLEDHSLEVTKHQVTKKLLKPQIRQTQIPDFTELVVYEDQFGTFMSDRYNALMCVVTSSGIILFVQFAKCIQ